MKFLLFFPICFLIVSQSFGQSNNTEPQLQNNGFNKNLNTTTEENTKTEENEELKLEVPEPKNLPELKKESEKYREEKDKISISSKKANYSPAKYESSFSSSRKIASTQQTSRSPSLIQQQEMNQAIDYYKVNAPESFEYHFFTYTAGNYDISLYDHLKKAQELKPANSDVVAQMAAYDIITEDTVAAEKNLTTLVEMGKIEQEVLSYDIDLLNSVSANGVLLTHGFDDSYGVFYLNSVANLRTDVKVISLDFMQSKAYRDSLQQDGFVIPASSTIDVNFLGEFCAKNESKNLFISMTFPKPYLTPLAGKLNIHGLTFSYGEQAEGILEENEILWEKLLNNGYVYKAKTEKGKQLSSNYLPLLFYLREYYEAEGESDLLIEIDKAIDRIGVQSNKYSKVNTMRGR